MAKTTNINLRNKMIYQVFTRQHSNTHDFAGVIKDLKRIKDLGTDILYLLPIHEPGRKEQKGAAGCPYSIYDFRSIDPMYGTLEDFKKLLDESHSLGMKVIIDIVYNHTSRDSVLTVEHPEWFYRNEDGGFENRVGDWSDITDLNFHYEEQWQYLIDTLVYWVSIGVDGFRCDVAPLIPYDFWVRAKEACSKINDDVIWFSESVHHSFIKHLRDRGFEALSDSETFQLFDILYDYDIMDHLRNYLKGTETLHNYLSWVLLQETTFPKNYVKARHLENHDCDRLAALVPDYKRARNVLAMSFFLRGIVFLYAGEEVMDPKRPSLFEVDEVCWDNLNKENHTELIKKLAEIKKAEVFASGIWNSHALNEDVALLSFKNEHEEYYGIFNVGESKENIAVSIPDGEYINILNDELIRVSKGFVKVTMEPIVFHMIADK